MVQISSTLIMIIVCIDICNHLFTRFVQTGLVVQSTPKQQIRALLYFYNESLRKSDVSLLCGAPQ